MKLEFCVACGSKKGLHHHHLVPRSKGGSNANSNLITLCSSKKGGCHAKIHGVNTLGGITANHADLIKIGMKKARDKGRLNYRPFGYELSSNGLLKNRMEQKVLRMMKRKREKGESFRSIAEWLESEGIRTPKGNNWHHASIQSALAFFAAQNSA